MPHIIQRLLITACVLGMLSMFASRAMATVYHDDQGAAYAGAIAAAQTCADYWNTTNSPPFECGVANASWSSGYCGGPGGIIHYPPPTNGMYYARVLHPNGSSYQAATCPGTDAYHQYPGGTECSTADNLYGTYNQGTTTQCAIGCEFEQASGAHTCVNGTCIGDWQPTGDTCSYTGGINPPEGCTASGDGTIVCDCDANPTAPFCPGGSNPGGDNCISGEAGYTCYDDPNNIPVQDPTNQAPDLPDQNPDPTPETPPTGDGDPDTPDGPGSGTGDGDTDEDGERDIDCDPQSNPDCSFTGSGTGSGDCEVQPTCDGDPVQCAILYQEWASMCYDGGSFTNPLDCQAPLECEGDVLKCEIIRQERQQYCDAFVGDGSADVDVFDDEDFGRDLKTEGDVIDLPTEFDQSGFGAGSCPAPLPFNAFGSSFSISLQPFCDFAGLIRALVILAALISAAFIVTGSRK
mgnify:CR=1 FL=1